MERECMLQVSTMRTSLLLLWSLALWMHVSVSQTPLKYYGVADIAPSRYAFLKDSLRGNFALVELQSDTVTWKYALSMAEQSNQALIIWPLGNGDRYTPWSYNGLSWDISKGIDVMQYAERYITSGGRALLAVLISHEPFYSQNEKLFFSYQLKMLYSDLKKVAPHVKLFIYMNDMAYYDAMPYRQMEDGMMDIAGIYKHSFGTRHTWAESMKEIDDDYALVQRKGLHMQLFFAFQTFATDGIEYRMPSAAEMLTFGTEVLESKKLDGFFWYPWDQSSTSYSRWLSKDRYDSTGADRWNIVTQLSSYLSTTGSRSAEARPAEFWLSQNYPNPFNPTTTVQVGIPRSGVYALEVFNVLGQKVAGVFHGQAAPGIHTVTIHAGNLPSGTYVYTLAGNNASISKTMTILK